VSPSVRDKTACDSWESNLSSRRNRPAELGAHFSDSAASSPMRTATRPRSLPPLRLAKIRRKNRVVNTFAASAVAPTPRSHASPGFAWA